MANGGSLRTPTWAGATSGWSTGNTVVLAVALTLAAVIAYLFYRRSTASSVSAGSVTSSAQHGVRTLARTVAVRPRLGRDSAPEVVVLDDELSWPSWAYAALAIVPLLYASVLYATEWATGEPLTTLLFYFCIAALIAGPALALARLTKLSGAEAGLYWLGAAFGGPLAVMLHAYQLGWTWTFPSSEQGGFVVLLVLIVLSAAGIAYLRRNRLSPVE